jgi:hypothetical protein
MSRQIPRVFASVALITTLQLGVGVTVLANTARAEDCLAAPHSTAPPGRHWFYRLDWETQKKCWYLRAPSQPAQQAAAPATLARVSSFHSTPPPSGPELAGDGVPMSITSDDTAPPPPHVKMLAVKPMPAPALSATTDKFVQQSGQQENTARPIPEVPAPQVNTASQTSAQAAAPPPVAWPAAPLVKASDPIVVPTNDDAETTARGREPTNNTGMPMIIFPLLSLGLAAGGILWRVVIKNAAARRAQITIDHAEPGIVDDQLQHEPVHERHALISAVSDYGPAEGAFQITHEIIKRKDKLAQLHQDLDRLLQAAGRPHDQRQSEPAAC